MKMHIFIWRTVNNLTENYHNDGGLVVIAHDIYYARELIESNCPKECGALKDDDYIQYELKDWSRTKKPEIYIFPDAGCC